MNGSSQTPQILGTFGMYLYNICIFKFCVLFSIFEIITYILLFVLNVTILFAFSSQKKLRLYCASMLCHHSDILLDIQVA